MVRVLTPALPMQAFPRITPTHVRFIKLGGGGEYEQSCIERDQTVRLGYDSPLHTESLDGNWDPVLDFWARVRKGNVGTARNDLRQIRDFYELPSTALWFTFYKRKLWWAFAEKEITELSDLTRIRRVIGRWSSTDIKGNPLFEESLDGRLSRVVGYRGTICGLEPQVEEYLVRRINGELPEDVIRAEAALTELQASVQQLVQGLHWKDFEAVVDVMFSRAGYQRLSVVGKTQKSIDIDLESPVTRGRAFVQVKSQASRRVFEECVADFQSMPQYHEFFFVCHSPIGLDAYESESPDIHLVAGSTLARLLIDAGLTGFLMSKRS